MKLSAKNLNSLAESFRPLNYVGPGGLGVLGTESGAIWGKLTDRDSTGRYSWIEQLRKPGGWSTGYLSGVMTAVEVNGLDRVPLNRVVKLYPWDNEEWVFQFVGEGGEEPDPDCITGTACLTYYDVAAQCLWASVNPGMIPDYTTWGLGGAAVSLYRTATPPILIGSGSSDDEGITCLEFSGLPSPTIAPDVSLEGSGSTIPNASYKVKYAWITAFGITRASPASSSVTVSSPTKAKIKIELPVTIPADVIGVRYYFQANGTGNYLRRVVDTLTTPLTVSSFTAVAPAESSTNTTAYGNYYLRRASHGDCAAKTFPFTVGANCKTFEFLDGICCAKGQLTVRDYSTGELVSGDEASACAALWDEISTGVWESPVVNGGCAADYNISGETDAIGATCTYVDGKEIYHNHCGTWDSECEAGGVVLTNHAEIHKRARVDEEDGWIRVCACEGNKPLNRSEFTEYIPTKIYANYFSMVGPGAGTILTMYDGEDIPHWWVPPSSDGHESEVGYIHYQSLCLPTDAVWFWWDRLCQPQYGCPYPSYNSQKNGSPNVYAAAQSDIWLVHNEQGNATVGKARFKLFYNICGDDNEPIPTRPAPPGYAGSTPGGYGACAANMTCPPGPDYIDTFTWGRQLEASLGRSCSPLFLGSYNNRVPGTAVGIGVFNYCFSNGSDLGNPYCQPEWSTFGVVVTE